MITSTPTTESAAGGQSRRAILGSFISDYATLPPMWVVLGFFGSLSILLGSISGGVTGNNTGAGGSTRGLSGAESTATSSVFHVYPFSSWLTAHESTGELLFNTGIAFLFLCWLCLWMKKPSIKTQWITLALWAIPLLFTIPAYSQDIYSYLAQGAAAAIGKDPYTGGPSDLLSSDNPLLHYVSIKWAHSPSPYGPLYIGLAKIISLLTNNAIIPGIILHRLVIGSGLIILGLIIPRVASRHGISPTTAFLAVVINPIVLTQSVVSIHNDLLMIALVMAGFYFYTVGHDRAVALPTITARVQATWLPYAAAFICVAGGIMVKVPAIAALPFLAIGIGIDYMGASAWIKRLGITLITVVAGTAVIALCIGIITLITGLSLRWIYQQGGAASTVNWHSPMTMIGMLLNHQNLNGGNPTGGHAASSLSGLTGDTPSLSAQLQNGLHLGNNTFGGGQGMRGGQGIHGGQGGGNNSLAIARPIAIMRIIGYIIIAIAYIVSAILAFSKKIKPLPALSIAMVITVIFFPVVWPWYTLWYLIPIGLCIKQPLIRCILTAWPAVLAASINPFSGTGSNFYFTQSGFIHAGISACIVVIILQICGSAFTGFIADPQRGTSNT